MLLLRKPLIVFSSSTAVLIVLGINRCWIYGGHFPIRNSQSTKWSQNDRDGPSCARHIPVHCCWSAIFSQFCFRQALTFDGTGINCVAFENKTNLACLILGCCRQRCCLVFMHANFQTFTGSHHLGLPCALRESWPYQEMRLNAAGGSGGSFVYSSTSPNGITTGTATLLLVAGHKSSHLSRKLTFQGLV